MRRLAFDVSTSEERQVSEERFDICYASLFISSPVKEARKVTRRAMKAFRAIGKESKESTTKLELSEESGSILLEEAEFKLLKERIDETPWSREAIEKADDCLEWLEGIKENSRLEKKDAGSPE